MVKLELCSDIRTFSTETQMLLMKFYCSKSIALSLYSAPKPYNVQQILATKCFGKESVQDENWYVSRPDGIEPCTVIDSLNYQSSYVKANEVVFTLQVCLYFVYM